MISTRKYRPGGRDRFNPQFRLRGALLQRTSNILALWIVLGLAIVPIGNVSAAETINRSAKGKGVGASAHAVILPAPSTTGATGTNWSPPTIDAAAGLRGALVHGYVDNPTLEARRSGQKAIDEGVAQAIAALRPSLTATAQHGYLEERRYGPDSKDQRRPQSATVSASLLLFDGFASINAVNGAESRALAGQEALSDAEQRLLAEIAAAYANVWRDRAIVNLTRQNVGFLAEMKRSAKRRKELGDLSRTDVAQADARYNEARANLSTARADLVAAESKFTELVGLAPAKTVSPRAPDKLLPRTLEAALNEAASHNPLVKKARHDEDAADHDVNARIGAFFPRVTLETDYEANAYPSSTSRADDEFTAYVRATFPFYDGGAKESRYREAKARAIEKSYERAATKRGVWSSVRSLWHRRIAAKARTAAAGRQLAAANLALRGLEVEAKVGQRSVIDVLDGERERVSAKIAHVRAMADHVTASYQLLAALGKCTPQNLGLGIQPYDATTRLASIKRSWLGLFVR